MNVEATNISEQEILSLNDDSDEWPDAHSSSSEYASRFTGPIGRWMLQIQRSLVLRIIKLAVGTSASLLDVGGGHGQIAEAAARSGYKVTVLGSNDPNATQVASKVSDGAIQYVKAPLSVLPFKDRSFDAVVCIRIVSHTPEWQALISELCRVAKKIVIIDYPSTRSLNYLNGALFHLKKGIEGNTRTFSIFSDKEISSHFSSNGLREFESVRQFMIPMGLHRLFQNLFFSRFLEAVSSMVGLTRHFGSPVIASYARPFLEEATLKEVAIEDKTIDETLSKDTVGQ